MLSIVLAARHNPGQVPRLYVSRHVATHIAHVAADQRLAESRQFEAFHRLTAFVMHDLKNLAAQLELIVSNAQRHRHNPEFIDDVTTTIANSTDRRQRLIWQLRRRDVPAAIRRRTPTGLLPPSSVSCATHRMRRARTVR